MKVKVLGTRGKIKPSAPGHMLHSGILIDNTLMFDCGEREYLSYNPQKIFLTHLHPDHAIFVAEPIAMEIPTYAPESFEWVDITVIAAPVIVGEYLITPIPTRHSVKVKSQAYLICKGQHSLLYTGDMIWIDEQYHDLFHGVDLVITEASYVHPGGVVKTDRASGGSYGHTGVPDLLKLFRDHTENILLVHFGSWFYKDIEASKRQLMALGEEYGVNLYLSYDGMELDLCQLKSSGKPRVRGEVTNDSYCSA